MTNLFLILFFILPLFGFSQSIKDFVNFDSFNKDLISNELIKLIINERNSKKCTPIFRDTVPMFAAKFHTMYFEQYGDESQIHSESKPVICDLYGIGLNIGIDAPTPENRLNMSELEIKQPKDNLKYKLIYEVSKFYKLNTKDKITYKELINNIYYDLISGNKNILIIDYSNNNKYLGISCGIRTDKDNFLITSTCVLSE